MTTLRKPLTKKQQTTFNKLLEGLGICNYSIHLSSGTKVGENFFGYIVEANAKGIVNNCDTEFYFILKCEPNEYCFTSRAPVDEAYKREIYMYSKVFHEFTILQNEKRTIIRYESYPFFYKCLKEREEHMLIFKNVKPQGFKNLPRHMPLDYNHVVLILKEYAKIHALSYALRDQKPEVFEEIASNMNDTFFQHLKITALAQIADHRFRHALQALDPVKDKTVFNEFKKFSERIHSTINYMYLTNRYSVINHIDCGIANYLFKYEHSSKSPTDVCVLDFQMSRLDSPAVDLCTLLFSATDKVVRKRFNDLIMEYYNYLCLFLDQLGSDSKKLLPFQILQDELKKYGVLGLFWALHLMYVQLTVNQHIPDIFNDDSTSEETFGFLYDLEDRAAYDIMVRDSILDFYKLGYSLY